MIQRAISLLLEFEQRLKDRDERFECADAFVPKTSMSRQSFDVNTEHERACVRGEERQASRLGDNGAIGLVSTQNGGQRASPTVFLGDHTLDDDVAARFESK